MKRYGYVVKAGDTPQSIALRITGSADRSQELVLANPQMDRRIVGKDRSGIPIVTFSASQWVVGRTINLPASWSAAAASGQLKGYPGMPPAIRPGVIGQFDPLDPSTWGDALNPTPTATNCNSDSQCDITQYCGADGTCHTGVRSSTGGQHPVGGPCGPNGECDGMNICKNGVCTTPGSVVISATHCSDAGVIMSVQKKLVELGKMAATLPDGKSSIDGAWGCISQKALEASGQSFKALLGGDCQGEVPAAANCGAPVIVPGCTSNADCTAPMVCTDGTCVAPPPEVKKSSWWWWILGGFAVGAAVLGTAYATGAVGEDKKRPKAGSARANPVIWGGPPPRQEPMQVGESVKLNALIPGLKPADRTGEIVEVVDRESVRVRLDGTGKTIKVFNTDIEERSWFQWGDAKRARSSTRHNPVRTYTDEYGYKVEDGVIRSPGKFEGEPDWAPYFWELGLDGGSDEELYEEEEGPPVWVFYPDVGDRSKFPNLRGVNKIEMWEDDQGFVHTELAYGKPKKGME